MQNRHSHSKDMKARPLVAQVQYGGEIPSLWSLFPIGAVVDLPPIR